MKRLRWQAILVFSLVLISLALYFVHFLIFKDSYHITIYLLGDIAFIPVEVLLVTLVVNKLLSHREKMARLDKLNMVIGAFFSEVGTDLLIYLSNADFKLATIRADLVIRGDWTDDDFKRVKKLLAAYSYDLDISKMSLTNILGYMVEKRDFLLRLLENPNLLEHEAFTELLRATFHMTEELEKRGSFDALPEKDIEHLRGDINRVYSHLVLEWLSYMNHLRTDFPYLFSLAMRTNPFDLESSPILR